MVTLKSVAGFFGRREKPSPNPPARKIPAIFMVELFAGCNLRCPLCFAGRQELKRRKYSISLADWETIFPKIEPYVETLYPIIWGESTLNPDFLDILSYTKRRKPSCKIITSTHGNGLSEDYASRLVATGVDQIIVDLDGVSQQVYEKFRRGGNVAEALAFIGYLVKARKDSGSPVAITAQCIQNAYSMAEREEFERTVRALGATPGFKPILIQPFDEKDYMEFMAPGVEVQPWSVEGCTALAEAITILSDGDVTPCCEHHLNEGNGLGNIFENSVEEIVSNANRRKMAEMASLGVAPSPMCASICARGPWDNQLLVFSPKR
jgi:radical SAM protein with 4Fe4S-binding SPASM domain